MGGAPSNEGMFLDKTVYLTGSPYLRRLTPLIVYIRFKLTLNHRLTHLLLFWSELTRSGGYLFSGLRIFGSHPRFSIHLFSSKLTGCQLQGWVTISIQSSTQYQHSPLSPEYVRVENSQDCEYCVQQRYSSIGDINTPVNNSWLQ